MKAGLLGGKTLTDSTLMEKDGHPLLCSCWNRGWAEVKIRRPTGSVSWLMRVQNQLDLLSSLDPLLTSHLTRDIGIAEINHTDLVSESSPMPSTTIFPRRSSSESSSPEEDCRGSTLVDDRRHTPSDLFDEEEPELLEVVDSELDGSETSSTKKSTAEDDSVPTSDPISISVRFERIHNTSNSSELCEFLPPLLSYEGNTRSPSLHSGSTLLNEQQQVCGVLVLVSSYWCPCTGVLVLVSSYWCPRTGVLVLVSSCWCPRTGVLVLVSSYWCPRTGVLVLVSVLY